MITVSEAATEILGRTLASYELAEGESLRLARSEAGEFGLAIDEEGADDVRVEFGEGGVVIVGAAIEAEFEGAVLDVADVGGAERLVLRVVE
jgi:hypothetical protein